jgi:type VI secretion system protein ImpC
MKTGIDLSFRFGPQGAASQSEADADGVRVGILGDFSGRAGRGLVAPPCDLVKRCWLRVDIDTFDQVLGALAPKVALPVTGGTAASVALAFASLDDFHPERLVSRVPCLARLLDLRQRLQSPVTFSQAAVELGCTMPAASGAGPGTAPAAPATGQALLAALLDQGGSSVAAAPPPRPAPAAGTGNRLVDSLVREAVGRSAVPEASPDLAACLSAADLQIADALCAVLHLPAFQALESLWRGVDLVVRRLPEEPVVELYLLDLFQAELAADLAQAQDPRRSATAALLADGAVRQLGDGGWALLVSGYTFGAAAEDLRTLEAMGRIAASLGCPWVAAARPEVLGCQSAAGLSLPAEWAEPSREWSAGWRELRDSAESAFLALACPRFLARLPYGTDTDPVPGIPVTEVADATDRERFLWANPAFLVALAWADSLAAGSPWDGQGVVDATVEDLPMVVIRGAAEPQVVPCSETWLPDRAVEAVAERGVTPVQSVRGQNSVRLRLRALHTD